MKSIFLSVLLGVSTVYGEQPVIPPVASSPTRTFELISQGGNAKVRENGKEMISVPQFRNYDLSIGKDGTISLQDVGTAGANYAWIRRILNPYGHKVMAKLKDKGQNQDFSRSVIPGISDFKNAIPWDQDSNSFSLTVQVVPVRTEAPKEPTRKYRLISQGGYAFIDDLVSGERIDESAGQFESYHLIIGPGGSLALEPITNYIENVALIQTIINECGYSYYINYHDDSRGTTQAWVDGLKEYSFANAIPWDKAGNSFELTIEVPKKAGDTVNGYPGVSNKRLNEFTIVKSHNGGAYKPNIQGLACSALKINDQNRSFKQQLYDGVRGTKFSLFFQTFKGKDNTITVCHGWRDAPTGNACDIDPATAPLIDHLRTLKAFLDTHPDAVFIMELEDVTDNKMRMPDKDLDLLSQKEDQIKKQTLSAQDPAYLDLKARSDKMFAHYTLAAQLIAQAVNDSGIKPYIYRNPDNKLPFPTLGEMIKTNKRLLLIRQAYYEHDATIYYAAGAYRHQTKYDFGNADALLNHSFASEAGLIDPKSMVKKGNCITDLSNYVTPGVAGCITDAGKVNTKDVLIRRANEFKKVVGYYPTELAVDFYQRGRFGAFFAAQQLNGVPCL